MYSQKPPGARAVHPPRPEARSLFFGIRFEFELAPDSSADTSSYLDHKSRAIFFPKEMTDDERKCQCTLSALALVLCTPWLFWITVVRSQYVGGVFPSHRSALPYLTPRPHAAAEGMNAWTCGRRTGRGRDFTWYGLRTLGSQHQKQDELIGGEARKWWNGDLRVASGAWGARISPGFTSALCHELCVDHKEDALRCFPAA